MTKSGILPLKILLANSFLVHVSPPASTVKIDASPVKTHTPSKLMFFLGRLRTLDKLDKIISELDGSYDRLSDMQAEGNTTGFTEELLWPKFTSDNYSIYMISSPNGKYRKISNPFRPNPGFLERLMACSRNSPNRSLVAFI